MTDALVTIAALRKLAILGLCERDAEARAVAERLLSFVEGSDVSLDEALGLSVPRGQPTWQVQRARQERNRLLRLAALAFFPNTSPKDAARALANEWHSYYRKGWLKDREAVSCPIHIRDTLREPLWRVMSVWPRLLSEKQIAEIIRDTDENPPIRSASEFQPQT